MRLALFAAALLVSSSPQAQLFQCVKDGTTSFQDEPCEATSRLVKTYGARGSGTFEWDALRSGLSVDEVRARLPDAKNGSDDRLHDGARQRLRLDGVSIAGVTLDAGFYFRGEGFTQVNLSGDPASNADNLKAFERVVDAFRAKYGRGTKHRVANERFGLSAEAEWASAEGRVWVSLTPVTGDTSLLTLGFVPKAR